MGTWGEQERDNHSLSNYQQATEPRKKMLKTFWIAVFVAIVCLAISQASPMPETKIIDGVPEKVGNLIGSILDFKGQMLNLALSPFHYVAGALWGSPAAEVPAPPANV